jgi:hypothetical protein
VSCYTVSTRGGLQSDTLATPSARDSALSCSPLRVEIREAFG